MKKKPAKKKRNGDLFLFAAQRCDAPGYFYGACHAFWDEGLEQQDAYHERERKDGEFTSRSAKVRMFNRLFKPEQCDSPFGHWWHTERDGQEARVIGLLLAKAMWERP